MKLKRKYLTMIMINILQHKKFNKLTADIYAVILAQANLATKADIDYLVEKTDFVDKLKYLNKNFTSNKT